MAKDQDALKMYLLDVQGFSQRNGVFQGNILNAMSFQHTSGYRIFNPPADTCTNYSSRENNDSRYFCTYFCQIKQARKQLLQIKAEWMTRECSRLGKDQGCVNILLTHGLLWIVAHCSMTWSTERYKHINNYVHFVFDVLVYLIKPTELLWLTLMVTCFLFTVSHFCFVLFWLSLMCYLLTRFHVKCVA